MRNIAFNDNMQKEKDLNIKNRNIGQLDSSTSDKCETQIIKNVVIFCDPIVTHLSVTKFLKRDSMRVASHLNLTAIFY